MNRNKFRLIRVATLVALVALVAHTLVWRYITSLDRILDRLSLGMSINEVLTQIPKRNLDGPCAPLDVTYISKDGTLRHDTGDDLVFWQTIQDRSGSIKDHLLFNSKLELCYIPKHHQPEEPKLYPDYDLELFTASVEANLFLSGFVTTEEPILRVLVWADGTCDVSFAEQGVSCVCFLPEELVGKINTELLAQKKEKGISRTKKRVALTQIRNLSSIEKTVLAYLSSNADPLGINNSKAPQEGARSVLSMIHAEIGDDVQHQ